MSFVSEVQPYQTESAESDDTDDDENNWDLEGAVVINNVKRVGAKHRLCEFPHICGTKKCKVTENIGDMFEMVK